MSEAIKTFDGFWRLCKACAEFKLGCAMNCELRKKLGLPPHGSLYRFHGEA